MNWSNEFHRLNDFDETLPGPFEWDVKRLAASITVAGRNNGFSYKKCLVATRNAMRRYREFIAETSELSPLDLYYYRFDSQTALERIEHYGKKHKKWKKEVLAKAARKNCLRALNKLTAVVDGRRVIIPNPPLVVSAPETLADAESEEANAFYESYRASHPLEKRVLIERFSPVDVARKVVGVGSVGTRFLILLLEVGDGTPLFLQFKQAVASVLEPYLGPSVFEHAGQRVVEGQRLIQATSDVLLGWARWQGADTPAIDFYFRQLWDGKGKIDVEELGPQRLAVFASICGKTLAYAHARSGDAMMVRSYLGDDETFEDVMVEFAEHYADRTEADHKQLAAAIDGGSIEVLLDL